MSLVMLRGSMDAAYRAPVPYLTLIATALGAKAESAGWLAIALSLAGLIAPVVGVVEARLGRRTMTVIVAGLFILSCTLMPFAPAFTAVLGLYVAVGVAKALFTPQVQAFIGESVPFEKRGMAVGFVELSWALGWVVGVPLFGFLIQRAAWWTSFLVFAAVGSAGLVAVLRFAMPRSVVQREGGPSAAAALLNTASVRAVLGNGTAVRLLIFDLLIVTTAQLATVVYAPYLLAHFKLDAEGLGLVSIVLGVADVVAELATVALVDRLGKRRAVLASCSLLAAAFLIVIVLAGALVPMMAGLFLLFLMFEFAIVAAIVMMSEAVPSARATMGGFGVAVSSLGRIIASAIALPLFAYGGLTLVMLLGAGLTALPVVVCWPVRVGQHSSVTPA